MLRHQTPSVDDEAAELSAASSTDELNRRIAAEVADLASLSLDDLRKRWRKLFRSDPLPHLPRWLLQRVIAYRIQANAFGDLDKETARFLDRVAKERQRRIASGEPRPSIPPIPPVPLD